MLTSKDIAWIAGFLEGEGSFISTKNNSRVTAPQKELWPLLRLKELVGGNIYPSKNDKCSTWQANGSLARGLAMTVYVLMSPKRQKQILNMLEKDTSKTQGTKEYYEMIKNRVAKSNPSRSKTLTGKTQSLDSVAKRIATMKPIRQTSEYRAKMSEAANKRWKKENEHAT